MCTDTSLSKSFQRPEGGKVEETRINSFLEELRALAEATKQGCFTAIFGYSFGGLLAALFQERWPHLVKRVVLLAPAIDNFARCLHLHSRKP